MQNYLHLNNPLVNQEEAAQRKEICAKCPFLEDPCVSCKGTQRKLRRVILRKKPNHPELGTCKILKEDVGCSVEMVLPPSDRQDLPPGCWRKPQ